MLQTIQNIGLANLNRFRRLFRASSQPIGLDIGSQHITFVRLKKGVRGWELVTLQVEELAPGITGMQAHGDQQTVNAALQRLITKAKIQGAQVAASISGTSAIIKLIEVPWMSEQELRGHLQWEVGKYLPYEQDDIYWDTHVHMSEGRHLAGSPAMKAYLVAAKKDVVDQRVEMIKRVGLEPTVIDLDGFALANMYAFNYDESDRHGPVLLVNFGPCGLNLVAIGTPNGLSIREAPIGNEWSQEVLLEGTRISRGQEPVGCDTSCQDQALEVLLKEIYKDVAKEIQRTIDDCNSYEPHRPIQRVMIGGSYTHLPKLMEELETRLGLSVERVNPFKNLIFPAQLNRRWLEAMSVHASVAVGLALRCSNEP